MSDEPRYQVIVTPAARKGLCSLPRAAQDRIVPRVDALGEEPRPHGVEKLKGSTDLYRIRIGDYRVIYRIADAVLIVTVIRVGHRKDVYGP